MTKYLTFTQYSLSDKLNIEIKQYMRVMKKKIAVTVDPDLVTWLDQQVKTQRFRNRSHAVDVALRFYVESEKRASH
jgi:hypothetical protein